MSADARDESGRLLADLRTYLEQRREAGEDWYLDAGSVKGAADPVPAPDPPPVRAGVLPAAPSPRPAVAAPPAAPAKQLAEEEFQRMCDAFVRDTLARIESNRRSVTAAEPDMFAVREEPPPPLSREEKIEALRLLDAEIAGCRKCKLHEGRNRTVPGAGDPDADLVFIGEAPGRDEDRQGEPFVGRAGQLLSQILEAIGFRREDVFICNILKCRPPNNRDPEAEEGEACEPYLKRQLAILEPRVICCLGRVAAQNLLGTRAALGALRETVHFYEGIPVMATFHPAALLRNPHWKRPTWDDVRKLRALHDALKGTGGAQPPLSE